MAIRFGYWMPLGSGGFVISNIPQRTDWSLDYNAGLAQTAEQLGFEYGLAPARFIASHGWELQQEAVTCTAVLAGGRAVSTYSSRIARTAGSIAMSVT